MELLMDIVYSGAIVIFFLMMWVLILLCEKLGAKP